MTAKVAVVIARSAATKQSRSDWRHGQMTRQEDHFAPVSLARAALACRCPRCGEGRLFTGLLTVRAACPSCALDFSAEDAGDGPAVFVILLGLIVVALVAWVELEFAPPLWLHMVLWTPLILAGAIVMLRPLRAGLIALQYRHDLLHSPPGT
jgi:uncharacterized protein (DUF983 family)